MPYNPWEKKQKDEKNEKDSGHFDNKNTQKKDINGSSSDGFFSKNNIELDKLDGKKTFFYVAMGIISLFLINGLFIVKPDEKAVVLIFGKDVGTKSSGLHFHLSYPIGSVKKESVTTIRTTKVGYIKDIGSGMMKAEVVKLRGVDTKRMGSNLMLTGDENIIDMHFEVQWRISNIKKYLFNVAESSKTVTDVSQSVIREIVGMTPLVSILTNGRSKIESSAKDTIQKILDSYGAGIEISLVQMLSADPPVDVISSFRDVQNARVDKESSINRASAYFNDVVPRARGQAEKIILDSEGQSIEIIDIATGEVEKFKSIYREYKNAPYIVKRKIYLETMSNLFRIMPKTIVDEKTSKMKFILPSQERGHMPYNFQRNVNDHDNGVFSASTNYSNNTNGVFSSSVKPGAAAIMADNSFKADNFSTMDSVSAFDSVGSANASGDGKNNAKNFSTQTGTKSHGNTGNKLRLNAEKNANIK